MIFYTFESYYQMFVVMADREQTLNKIYHIK